MPPAARVKVVRHAGRYPLPAAGKRRPHRGAEQVHTGPMTDEFHEVRGLPQTRYSGYTPAGEIEQAGKLADAVNSQTGWRRVGARILVALLAFAFAAPLVFWAVSAVQ